MDEIKDTYLTLDSAAEVSLFKDKGSKFYGYAFPLQDESQVKAILAGIKEEHFSARHCCYAWRLGNEEPYRYRPNDDGEPSGSAGIPIYNQILSAGMTNVLVVVVRYFGGILLGVPGLINAYKTTAASVLEGAQKVEKIIEVQYEVCFGYPEMNAVMRLVKEFDLRVVSQDMQLDCTLVLGVRKSVAARVEDVFSKLHKVCVQCVENS